MPVTVAVKVPGFDGSQSRAGIPCPCTEYGVTIQTRLAALLVTTRFTASVNPFSGDTVIHETPSDPTKVKSTVGLAEIEKSGCDAEVTEKVIVDEWVSSPLVPFTVNKYDPRGVDADVETVATEVRF